MKRFMQKALMAAVPAFAVLTVTIAKLFAAMPCHGIIYEAETPEQLR